MRTECRPFEPPAGLPVVFSAGLSCVCCCAASSYAAAAPRAFYVQIPTASTSYRDRVTARAIHTTPQAVAQPPLMPCARSVADENRLLGSLLLYCWAPCAYSRSRLQPLPPNCTAAAASAGCSTQPVRRRGDCCLFSCLCCHTELATPRRIAQAQEASGLEACARGGRKRRSSSPDAARCHRSVQSCIGFRFIFFAIPFFFSLNPDFFFLPLEFESRMACLCCAYWSYSTAETYWSLWYARVVGDSSNILKPDPDVLCLETEQRKQKSRLQWR